ncbi:NF-kappa-B-activating protein-like [Lineus longissimus]|uniref:NF-kappa-B-activating protein-like n=1 Tax=Lineus longissimus TaxID=88925 RepID=UPI002B4F0972
MDRKRPNYSRDRDRDYDRDRQKKIMKYDGAVKQSLPPQGGNPREQEDRHLEEKREMRELMLREHVSNNPNKGPWASIGKDVKVVQCWRCKDYGHRSGDQECRLLTQKNKSTEIFRFEHEDPMHKYFEERKRKEKEERVEQLKLLLEDSSTDSDSNSDSSSSRSPQREKHKKCKKKKKDVKSKTNKHKPKTKKIKVKSKKDQTRKKSKREKKKQSKKSNSCSPKCNSETGLKMLRTQDHINSDDVKLDATSLNCDKGDQHVKHDVRETASYGPSPRDIPTRIQTICELKGRPVHVASIKNNFSSSEDQKASSVPKDIANSDAGRPAVSESELQRELRRFRIESLQLKGQVLI